MSTQSPTPEERLAEQLRVHNIMVAQLQAREQLAKEHPIAARKARQRAEAEQRKMYAVNLSFGNLTMKGRT